MTSVGSGTWRDLGTAGQTLLAAGRTDAGVQREVNEDRFHVDATRGLFVVIDGVGGQAAGGRAADVALSMLRERLERETGPVTGRIREAIAVANNEIHRLAATRTEWQGMACVLTAAIVNNGKATIGHVGDTRLYKIRHGRIEKITRDHSPVGEREDAGELSEAQAMRHPRRNEVYRDVGSDQHTPDDLDFIDLVEVSFEPDAAMLLCTDGLTDLVDSGTIARVVAERAGDPEAVVTALIAAANAGGGKDNVTVVYVEGDQFASRRAMSPARPNHGLGVVARPAPPRPSRRRRAFFILAFLILLLAVAGAELARRGVEIPWLQSSAPAVTTALLPPDVLIVQPGGSIAAALRDAPPDSEIIVEPGEYREQLVLKDRVRVVSRVPRGATIRLPAAAPDSAAVPAVVAAGLSRAELVGFRVVGDSATPLSVGIHVENSAVSIADVDVSGATRAAIEFLRGSAAALLGSDLRNNPGAAIIIHAGATPRIAHNVFARNATSERAAGALVIMKGAAPRFTANVFLGLTPESLLTLDNAARLALKNENWFVPVSDRRANRGPVRSRPRQNK